MRDTVGDPANHAKYGNQISLLGATRSGSGLLVLGTNNPQPTGSYLKASFEFL